MQQGGRTLAAVLFTDMVDSTAIAEELGDRRWKALVDAHHRIVRRELKRFGGNELDTAGDGFFASFKEPAPAITCACAISEAVRSLGVEIRAGVHFGECERIGKKLGGITVVVGARLMALGSAGEVLVSSTAAELARGASFGFEDRGMQTLKGVDGDWRVFAATTVEGKPRPAPSEPSIAKRQRDEIAAESGRRRRTPVAIAGIVAFTLVVGAIVLPLMRSGKDAIALGSNTIARLDAVDGALSVATPLGERPGATAAGFGSLWVAQPDQGTVVRLDLDDGSIIDAAIRVGNAPNAIAVDDDSVWVTNQADGTVSRINVETNEVSQLLEAGSQPSGIAIGDGFLWIVDTVGAALLRIDPASGESRMIELDGQPSGVSFTPGAVWVATGPDEVARVDPSTMTVALTQSVGGGPAAIVPAFDDVWVANHLDGTVTRLEPATGRVVATIAVGDGPNALAASDDGLWVSIEYGRSVVAIDPVSNTVERIVPVGATAESLVADGEDLWLTVSASPIEHRGGTLRVSSSEVPTTSEGTPSLDPAMGYGTIAWQFLTTTNDGLLAYKRVGGPDGVTLVPDLASALPEVSADGLTYRFSLREGIRYSTGDLVLPEDFRHALERTLSMSGDGGGLFWAIKGAASCMESPSSCDLSNGIEVGEGTVTFHLANPDSDLPFKLAMPFAFPVPVETPAKDQGLDPVPATGPYKVASANRTTIELVRNPLFSEWSGAAQPDGFVDAISWRFRQDPAASFEQLNGGDIDLIAEPPRPEDIATLLTTHPDQVVRAPSPFTLYVGFDVQKPPFDDEDVRQAVNYAIDRAHVVEVLGGSSAQRVTCQILPPNFQGYAHYCPYTLDPEAGVWSEPDLETARDLIDWAGAKGEPVTVWVMQQDPYVPDAVEVMQHVTKVLDEIGLRATLTTLDQDRYFNALYPPAVAGSPEHPHVFLSGWASDYPGAANFIQPQFGCGSFGNPFGWCDRALEARIDKALKLYVTAPGSANRAWSAIDQDLVDTGAIAALSNPILSNAVSDRTGNIQVNPQWGILLSRLWVQ